jgi:hypothetical protein
VLTLAKAHLKGREPTGLSVLEEIPESRLRNAIKMISFEEGGLGTFDHLGFIGHVDELYLLLREWQFYKNRMLLLIAPDDGE